MEKQIVEHITLNGKFKIQFERSAVKGQDGFKIEANGDNLQQVEMDAERLLEYACAKTVWGSPLLAVPAKVEVKA